MCNLISYSDSRVYMHFDNTIQVQTIILQATVYITSEHSFPKILSKLKWCIYMTFVLS